MAEASPLVSIIIPCYNAEAYIGDAIQSALEQTYPHKEVIIVDDGSSDRSLEVIRSFGNQVRWEAGPNRGACAARNRGIALARGTLLQFLDADDLLYPEKLAVQVAATARQNPMITYCDGVLLHRDGTCEDYLPGRRAISDPVEFALNFQGVLSPLHYRKQLLALGGFDTELPCTQEKDLHLRLACQGANFYHIPMPLFTVRAVPESISRRHVVKRWIHRPRIVRRAYELLQARNELTERRALLLAAETAIAARHCLRHNFVSTAREFLEAAAQMHPSGGIRDAYGIFGATLCHVIGAERTEGVYSLLSMMASAPHSLQQTARDHISRYLKRAA